MRQAELAYQQALLNKELDEKIGVAQAELGVEQAQVQVSQAEAAVTQAQADEAAGRWVPARRKYLALIEEFRNADIIESIRLGCDDEPIVEADRRSAIHLAVRSAGAGDVVLMGE